MQQKELATLLGVTPAMVSRHVKRGMPVDTLERAEKWRRRHLEPGRVKGSRADTITPRQPSPPKQAKPAPAALGATVADLELDGSEMDEAHAEARTRREIAEANIAEIKEAELSGKFVEKSAVDRAVYEAARGLRDGMTNCSRRLAAEVATLTTPEECEYVIAKELRHMLEAFSRQLAQKIAPCPGSPSGGADPEG